MNRYIDLHCHPAQKPYSKSYGKGKVNSKNHRRDKNSMWFYDPPTLLDKIINYIGTLTKFSQANFTALARGNVGLICTSLYPIEKGFLVPVFGTGPVADLLADFVMEIGTDRVNHVQASTQYFNDLEEEYNFHRQLHGVNMKLNRTDRFEYRLVSNFQEVLENEQRGENIISVVVSIEGGHVFNTGLGEHNDSDEQVIENVDKVKAWEYRPFFITVAHHFYNQLCGHAASLAPILTMVMDQTEGLGTGFTELGRKVTRKLLDNTDGDRILVDIKHMSPQARKEYFHLLDEEFPGEDIPVIISHGGVNALHSMNEPVTRIGNSQGIFMQADINFYDVELLELAKRGGIIGLQMDERRVASEALLKQAKGKIGRRKILFHRSRLLWNQVRHIAEVLDREGHFAWGIQSLGTDFDGIIDPLNGYWTAEELPHLDDYLLKHAFNYMAGEAKNLTQAGNRNIDPEEIVSRVMTDNAYEFLGKYFK